MKKLITVGLAIIFLASCNPTTLTFSFVYNDEGPNKEIATKMKELLESEFNVEIMLIEGLNTNSNLDSLILNKVDIALVENYVPYQEGLNSAFSVYSEVLHLLYKEGMDASSFASLMYAGPVYIGRENSPTYNLMMDLWQYYGLDGSQINVTHNMPEANVVVELTNLFNRQHLHDYDGFKLFSFDDARNMNDASVVQGITLKYPRLSPFIIPENSYWSFTDKPIVTLSVDLVMMVRSGMGEVAVNDFTKTMLRNRQIFTSIDPLLFEGMKEDFDQAKLNIPLHEGARIFLEREEPSFIERYAELGGVILSIIIALWSGIISLTKWQAQKKKDKIDEFYEDLMNIKNGISRLVTVADGMKRVKRVQAAQNKAFEMLIAEKLIANDSFRIYMELSKETINELRGKMRILKAKHERATS